MDSEEEKLMLKSNMDNAEIKEWRMQLRENEVSLEEENIKSKKMKLRELEESVKEHQQKQMEDKEELERKQKEVEVKEAEVVQERDNLRRLEFEADVYAMCEYQI